MPGGAGLAEAPAGTIICEGCGFHNASYVRFCTGCGRLLRRVELQTKGPTLPGLERNPGRGRRSWLRSLATHRMFLLGGTAIGFLLAQWIVLPPIL